MSLDKAALETLRLDDESDSGRYADSPARRYRWWVLAALAALLLAALGWRVMNSAVPVQTVTVSGPAAGAGDSVLNASGYVVARRLATVSSKVTGRVAEVLFEEGAVVEQGQVLARLDDATESARYEVAQRSLEAARRKLREIEVRLADAARTLERNRSLVQRQLIAQSALDSAEAESAALAARLAAAQADVAVAESNLRLSRQALDDLIIRAPFAGVIISKDAQPGEMVSPISAGGGFTRTGIATIVDMESREIEVDVNESYINRVHEGQPVEAVLDAYPDWRMPARVISIVPTADRQKATVRVRIAFERMDPRILPDMGIKVAFKGGELTAEREQLPSIPDAALLSEGGSDSVWVVRDGIVERRAVEVGDSSGGRVPVLEGLSGGESIVIDAPRRLREGDAVELVDPQA